MTELEQLKQELDRLTKKVEELEKQEERENSRYPKKGEWYWYIAPGRVGTIVGVVSSMWDDRETDKYYWDFRHGSTDKAKVEWTIKHIELVNEIKKYTRPYIIGVNNWNFVKTHFTQFAHKKCTLTIFEAGVHNNANEYGFFDTKETAIKFSKQFGEEYILKFLFEPTDGDYKGVMDWLAEQEEEQ